MFICFWFFENSVLTALPDQLMSWRKWWGGGEKAERKSFREIQELSGRLGVAGECRLRERLERENRVGCKGFYWPLLGVYLLPFFLVQDQNTQKINK